MQGLGEARISTFTQAVKRTFDIAMARLPEALHGHLERAHALVLHRHVFPDEHGKHAQVLSSDGTRWYPVNGHCTCMDASRTPQGLCKHKLAFGLYRRASELLASAGGAPARGSALPEAPASVNVRLCIGGADVQWTLRDQDEDRLAERLARLLARFPQAPAAPVPAAAAPAAPAQPTPEGWCLVHGISMKLNNNERGRWYSHRLEDGAWCKGKK